MALARIITRSQACSRQLAMDLLARGYAVEIVSPDQIPDNLADLELRVEEDPGNQLLATVETHTDGRSASLDFTHHLRAPMGEFIRRIPEPGDVARLTGQIVNFADADRIRESLELEAAGRAPESQPILQLTAKAISSVPPAVPPAAPEPPVESLPVAFSKVASVSFERDEQQPTRSAGKTAGKTEVRSGAPVAPTTVIRLKLPRFGHPFAGFSQKVAGVSRVVIARLPRRLLAPKFELPRIAIPKIRLLDIKSRIAIRARKLKRLMQIPAFETPALRWSWSAGLGFAAMLALALILAFGLRHYELRPAADSSAPSNTMAALAGNANSMGSSDIRPEDRPAINKAEAARPLTEPAVASDATRVNRALRPGKVKVQEKNQDDFVAPNTVTYLDDRFAPHTVATSKQAHKSPKTVARRRGKPRKRRDDVIAASKVTYLDKSAQSQKATK